MVQENNELSPREILYYFFYIITFSLSIWTGFLFGFEGNSHTPPFPFVIEILTLPIGTILFLADFRMYNSS